MDKLDKSKQRFYRIRRVSTIMSASEYGQFLYIKHQEDIDEIIAKHHFQIEDKERMKMVRELYKAFWESVGTMIYHEVEFKWGWRKYRAKSKPIRHPFSINYVKTKEWERWLAKQKGSK